MYPQTWLVSGELLLLCRKRRLQRIISPTRNDAFAMGDQTPDASVRTYADIMREQNLARERDNTMQVCHLALRYAHATTIIGACHSFCLCHGSKWSKFHCSTSLRCELNTSAALICVSCRTSGTSKGGKRRMQNWMPCQPRPQASSCRPRQSSQQRQRQGRSGGIAGIRVVTRECRCFLCGSQKD